MRPVPTREARGQKTWTGFGAISRNRPVPPCSQAPDGSMFLHDAKAAGGCRLHEVRLGVVGVVVDELVAGGAVPAHLDGSAAGGVTRGVVLVGVPAPPVGEQAERAGEFDAFGGDVV